MHSKSHKLFIIQFNG